MRITDAQNHELGIAQISFVMHRVTGYVKDIENQDKRLFCPDYYDHQPPGTIVLPTGRVECNVAKLTRQYKKDAIWLFHNLTANDVFDEKLYDEWYASTTVNFIEVIVPTTGKKGWVNSACIVRM